MNEREPASAQIESIKKMELWLRLHEDEREKLNNAVFGIANRMNVHPHDLAIYILIRTNSL